MGRPGHASGSLVRTDPRRSPRTVWAWLDRILAGKLVHRQDAAFVQDMVTRALILPLGLMLFVPGAFSWALAAVYLLLVLPQCGPTAVVVHMVTHRPLFIRRLRVLDSAVTWWLAPFFGVDPGSYLSHHVGMHHPEENGPNDKSSTMRYRRDHWWDFCLYWWRFATVGKLELVLYLRRTRRNRLLRRFVRGELFHKALVLSALLVDWRAGLVVFVIPFVIVRWGLMMGNWAQHAFIDPDAPTDPYRNAVTLINCPYNHKMYNDGYHCGHHVKATLHWSDAPSAFEADLDSYTRRRAVVFDGLRGFQKLWWLLMRRRYDELATYVVPWSSDMESLEARASFLRTRTAPISSSLAAGRPNA